MKCGVFLYVYTDCGLVSLARLRPVRGRRTRIKYVIGLTGLAEAFRHSWYQSKVRVNIRELERYIALFRSLYTAGRDPGF